MTASSFSWVRAALLTGVLDAWAVLMPVACAGCGRPDRGLCADCAGRLAPEVSWHRLADGTPVASALDYSGVARQMILAFKEQGRTDAARALAAPLTFALAAAESVAGPVALELATVPTARASYRRRGYDPVALLLRRARFAPSPVLRHSRWTLEQKALDADGRSRNLVGSLCAADSLAGRQFIIVDDVMTTGATLTEAARAIRQGGGEVIAAATLAHTERLFPVSVTSS